MTSLVNVKEPMLSKHRIKVVGGTPLSGTVSPDGAKNSVLYALLASTFIKDGWLILNNVPTITDVTMTLKALEEIGLSYKQKDDQVKIIGNVKTPHLSNDYASKTRASIAFLGALLAQFGEVTLPFPGGDQIGVRPIDIHESIVNAFGGRVYYESGMIKATMDGIPLVGKELYLRYPSVGATINAIFMGITAKGTTTILNAAKEPEIVDFITLLCKMGAQIRGGGTEKITITGVKKLFSAEHDILPDRLEAGALLVCFAVTGGKGKITNCIPQHNKPLIQLMRQTGINVTINGDVTYIDASKPIASFDAEATPYPGLATDLQAVTTAYALVCPGVSSLKDTVFEERFGHVDELRKMGATIEKTGNKLYIHQGVQLTGAMVQGNDIRTVVSLIATALSINDTTYISGIEHLMRGHHRFVEKLQSLNANIYFE